MKIAAPYLELVQIALRQIELYKPQTEWEFYSSLLVQDAVALRLQEIGENLVRIRRLDEDAFRDLAPESWHKVIGLRNIIAHGYEVIDPARIWRFLVEDFAEFSTTIDTADNRTGLPLAGS